MRTPRLSRRLPAVRLGYVTEMHWPRGPGKTTKTRQEKNNELLYESATGEEESLASDNEEDLSIVFLIDDEAEED